MRRVLMNLVMPAVRHLRLLLVLLLFYCLQMCVMPYMKIAGITPNILWIFLSVVVTGFDWYDSAICGALIGIIMETMCPTIPMLNLAGYLVITVLMIPFFKPKSARQLLQAKYAGKTAVNVHKFRKTILCIISTNLIWQTVNCCYVFLNNNHIPGEFIRRGVANVIFTTVLAFVAVPLCCMLLGIKKAEPKETQKTVY